MISGHSPRCTLAAALAVLAAALLAACGSAPIRSTAGRDGPEPNPPPDLIRVPNALPRVELIRVGGPNKPYEIFGVSYEPMTRDEPLRERGLASWYGRKFHGRPTASGEIYNMYAMTAAHPTLPIPSYARITNPKNGREVIVRINDRGPFSKGRVVDVSYTAALKLDILRGVTPVEVERLTHDMIRSGAWRRAPAPTDEPPTAARPAAESTADTRMPAPPLPPTAMPDALPAETPRLESLPDVNARTAAARGWWLQLGAFSQRESAVQFQRRLIADMEDLAPLLALFQDKPLHKVQAGPYASREEAQAAAQAIRSALQMAPMLVQRR